MEDSMLSNVRKVFLTPQGHMKVRAIAWSEDCKCLCFYGFDDRWIEVWLEPSDTDDTDVFITNNGTPAGGAAKTLWGDWD
jgi:hypothetical protein